MTLYESLVKFKDGNADEWDVRRSCGHGVVQIQTINQKNLGKSLVSLTFDRDEYVELFTDTERDDSNNQYLVRVAFNPSYHSNVFIDYSYFSDDEWNEGYIFDSFSEENKELFTSLVRQLNPSLLEKKNQHDRYDVVVFKFMLEMFDSQISNINGEYASLYDDCLVAGLKEYIMAKLCDKFQIYGIYEKQCTYKYFTTVNVLLSIWKRTESSEDDDIKQVLRNLVTSSNLELDEDLYEDYYAYYDHKNFDQESFDREVTRNLEKIQEKIEEEMEEGVLEKNKENFEKLSKLNYNLGVWYDLPTQKKYGKESDEIFRIDRVNFGKIEIFRKKKENSYNVAKSSMSYDDFLNYLYHPELFN